MTINNIYPWGRSFEEYRRMFALTDHDLDRRILGCADGPASFNAAMQRLGHFVVSCDPLYRFEPAEIRARIDSTFGPMLELATSQRDRFVWDIIRSPEELGRVRMEAMADFLGHYRSPQAHGRYVAAAVPELPFSDGAFDLALCSHFLFLYSDELPLDFHRRAVMELFRVAGEARVFPLLDMRGRPSPHLDSIVAGLPGHGLRAAIDRVPYEFQRGGNQMLRIVRAA